MQIIYLINQLTSRVAAALRQRHSEHLSAALSREFVLTDPDMRADIQRLIEATTSTATPATAVNCVAGQKGPTASAARIAGGFRTMPMPGLPTHIRYSTS